VSQSGVSRLVLKYGYLRYDWYVFLMVLVELKLLYASCACRMGETMRPDKGANKIIGGLHK